MNSLFPYPEQFQIAGRSYAYQMVREILACHLTEERRARMRQVVSRRTYTVVSVLEDIYDRGNISAVMRSSEAMGFQAMHVIETHERFKAANRVTQGADKWLDVQRWSSTSDCLKSLKAKGYMLCATSLEASTSLEELTFNRPTAVILGNEKEGVSQETLRLSDVRVRIPMHGFVQSYNISVAGALLFYHIYQWRHRELGSNGDLSLKEQDILEAEFYLRSVTSADQILARMAQ